MRNRHNTVKYFSLLLSVVTLLLLFGGCTPANAAEAAEDEIELNNEDIIIAVTSDNPVGDVIDERYPKAEIFFVNNNTDGFAALAAGNVDAFVEQRVTYDCAIASGVTGIRIHPDSPIGEPGIVAGVVSNNTKIPNAKKLADDFLTEMEDSGILDDIYRRWVVEHDYTMPEITPAENPKYTIRIGTSCLAEPYTFYVNGKPAGYDIELCYRFAAWAGADVEFYEFDWNTIVEACVTGKVDYVFSNLYITPERSESVEVTKTYLTFDSVLIVRDTAQAAAGGGFFGSIKESFEKTFIREARWKLLLDGLWTTVRITLLAAFFGTLLGLLLCIAERSRFRVLHKVIAVFNHIISGTPVLVVMMIVYFVIFAHTGISAEIAGTLTFSVMFAVTVSGVLTTGINSVGGGQWEAAEALGLKRRKAFIHVIIPQAMRIILPIYKGEFVSMMKLTSIVGYISIIDLTKVGDIIRSRTFDAFFPLIVIAAIYFCLSRLVFAVIDGIEIKFDPSKRRHTLPKDVKAGAIPPAETVAATEHNGEEIIRFEHVKKVYDLATPLTDVNASVKRGEVITVIGPSGTGKSTLLRMLNRLEEQTEGKIFVFGQDTESKDTDMSLIRQRMGMVFQSFNLFDHLSVIENIMLAPVLLKKMTRQQAFDKGMQLLETVGLAERAVNYPYELSGGQKQRVAIARALAMEPEVILFDEPTSALDPGMVGEVLAVIKKLSTQGLTMMIITHEMQFARDVSTRIFYMDQGVIYEDGAPEKIFDAPERNRTRAFVNKLKTLHLEIESKKYDFIGMTEELRKFAQKNYLSKHRSENLVRCFEEICAQPIIPADETESKLHIIAEYDEKNDGLSMQFIRDGERFDPVSDGDALSAKLIEASCETVNFKYENGKNTLTLYNIKQ